MARPLTMRKMRYARRPRIYNPREQEFHLPHLTIPWNWDWVRGALKIIPTGDHKVLQSSPRSEKQMTKAPFSLIHVYSSMRKPDQEQRAMTRALKKDLKREAAKRFNTEKVVQPIDQIIALQEAKVLQTSPIGKEGYMGKGVWKHVDRKRD